MKQLALISGSDTLPHTRCSQHWARAQGLIPLGGDNPVPIHMCTFLRLEVARWVWLRGEGGGHSCPWASVILWDPPPQVPAEEPVKQGKLGEKKDLEMLKPISSWQWKGSLKYWRRSNQICWRKEEQLGCMKIIPISMSHMLILQNTQQLNPECVWNRKTVAHEWNYGMGNINHKINHLDWKLNFEPLDQHKACDVHGESISCLLFNLMGVL